MVFPKCIDRSPRHDASMTYSARVLARRCRVESEDQPPFPACDDGRLSRCCRRPSPWREIVGRQTAGYVEDLDVNLGTAAWITTGSPVPLGADAVVPVEATEQDDGHVVIVDRSETRGTTSAR